MNPQRPCREILGGRLLFVPLASSVVGQPTGIVVLVLSEGPDVAQISKRELAMLHTAQVRTVGGSLEHSELEDPRDVEQQKLLAESLCLAQGLLLHTTQETEAGCWCC